MPEAQTPATTNPPATPNADTPWFSDTQKDYVTGKGWKTAADAVDSYRNLETLHGADKAGRTVILPKDANDAEGMKAFRSKLGVPDKPEDYQLPLPEGHSPEFAQFAATMLHKNGVPKAAGQQIAKEWNEHVTKMGQEMEAQSNAKLSEAMNGLQQKWGQNFGANTELAKRSAAQFIKAGELDEANGKSILDALEKSAPLRQLFAAIGKSVAEHGFGGGEGGGGFGDSNAQIQVKLDELRANRVAGKIDQDTYFSEQKRLAGLMK